MGTGPGMLLWVRMLCKRTGQRLDAGCVLHIPACRDSPLWRDRLAVADTLSVSDDTPHSRKEGGHDIILWSICCVIGVKHLFFSYVAFSLPPVSFVHNPSLCHIHFHFEYIFSLPLSICGSLSFCCIITSLCYRYPTCVVVSLL